MGKQTIFSFLFFASGLFFSSVVQAEVNLDDLEECPNPKVSQTALQSTERTGKIDPSSIKVLGSVVSNETIEVGFLPTGYTCKAATVETENYDWSVNYVKWTLVKQDENGGKRIWAVDLGETIIYLGYVEPGSYTFSEAKDQCDKQETIVREDGSSFQVSFQVQMTLPEIGFGKEGTDPNSPLNFELLKSLNYTSVVSNENNTEVWFWSRSPYYSPYAWAFHSVDGRVDGRVDVGNRYYYGSVRCVGL